MNKYDILIVGAGLFGSTYANLAKKTGKKCLVIDKRSHIGGNVYTENIEGINVHKYGPHIFHTSNRKVWDYVNKFATFNNYVNKSIANYNGELYSLPFNMYTFNKMWGLNTPEEAIKKIESQRVDYGREPLNLEEQAISMVGTDIYEKLIKGYTEKQWGRKCTELPPSIIKRLPLRFTYDNNYFNDIYQGIPIGGYTSLVEKQLEGIEVRLDCNYFDDREYFDNIADMTVFTGSIDEFFDYCYGKLEYRTVNFETEKLDIPNYQGNAIINYTDRNVPYTRIIEHKHFETFGDSIYHNKATVITKEYSTEFSDGKEPYYPVNNERNNSLYKKYYDRSKTVPNVLFGGRLGEYKYYDMAPIIEKALEYYE